MGRAARGPGRQPRCLGVRLASPRARESIQVDTTNGRAHEIVAASDVAPPTGRHRRARWPNRAPVPSSALGSPRPRSGVPPIVAMFLVPRRLRSHRGLAGAGPYTSSMDDSILVEQNVSRWAWELDGTAPIRAFKTLGDPARLAFVAVLGGGRRSAKEMQAVVDVPGNPLSYRPSAVGRVSTCLPARWRS